MIKRSCDRASSRTSITFCLSSDEPVSVVGDFNGWDPHVHPLKKRSNGTRSTRVTVPNGSELRFRYLSGSGDFFDDPDADLLEPNGFGGTHGVVLVEP